MYSQTGSGVSTVGGGYNYYVQSTSSGKWRSLALAPTKVYVTCVIGPQKEYPASTTGRYLRVFCGDEDTMTNSGSDYLGRLIRANCAAAGIKQPSHSWRGV